MSSLNLSMIDEASAVDSSAEGMVPLTVKFTGGGFLAAWPRWFVATAREWDPGAVHADALVDASRAEDDDGARGCNNAELGTTTICPEEVDLGLPLFLPPGTPRLAHRLRLGGTTGHLR